MKIGSRLSKEQKQQLHQMASKQKKKRKRNKNWFKIGGKREKPMNRKEVEELMGVHMDTYKRVNGAVRRK